MEWYLSIKTWCLNLGYWAPNQLQVVFGNRKHFELLKQNGTTSNSSLKSWTFVFNYFDLLTNRFRKWFGMIENSCGKSTTLWITFRTCLSNATTISLRFHLLKYPTHWAMIEECLHSGYLNSDSLKLPSSLSLLQSVEAVKASS